MDIQVALSRCVLFSGLTPAALDRLSRYATFVPLRGGEVLFEEGSESDSLYLVCRGRLRVMLPPPQLPAEVAAGETLGEIGVITGDPRMATVVALRDSMLLKLAAARLCEVLEDNGPALLDFTRLIVHRLRNPPSPRPLADARSVRTIAIVPLLPGVEGAAVARALTEALKEAGTARCVDARTVDAALGLGTAATEVRAGASEERLLDWLHVAEAEHRYLVYAGTHTPDAWTQRCLRQADRIVALAPAASRAATSPISERLAGPETRAPVELILLGAPDPGGDPLGWRAATGARFHHWLGRSGNEGIARLARELTGRAVGLVLGGGGARGFTHIGLLHALRARGVPVDVVGGTSMGAFIGCLHATGRSPDQVTEAVRATFVRRNLLNDYTLPWVSLIRGRRFLRHLFDLFGEIRIEQLPTPFFCVSTNLTRGEGRVHDQGPAALWVSTSMCVPGIAPPVVENGELLADGAVVNSLPTDIMLALGRGPILSSDVSTAGGVALAGVQGPDPEALLRYRGHARRPGLADILFRTATLTSDRNSALNARNADVYLRMPVNDIGMFEWARLDELVSRGRDHAEHVLACHAGRLGF